VYSQVNKENDPVIVIENKVDYGKYVGEIEILNFSAKYSDDEYPLIIICPIFSVPNLTIVTYGGMVDEVIQCLSRLFTEFDFKAEVIVLTKINPIDYTEIICSVEKTKRLVVIEEGSKIGGISSEVISSVLEKVSVKVDVLKIGSLPIPIPSVRSLEDAVLPGKNHIIQTISNRFK
jgi:pyruvate/2-oxoglutarate/acetoin dehydrogenase E1 component